MSVIKEISTDDLKKHVQLKQAKIVDVRSADAYNGWRMKGEKRGGHIQGARSLPAIWTNDSKWIDTVHRKNISPDEELIIYGYTKEDAEKTAFVFQEHGYKKIYLYNSFMEEWVVNEKLPMDYLPNYRHLVPAEWVKQLIAGTKPQHYGNNKFVVIHAHYRNREAYLSGHIPGAIDMDTLALETPDTWNRRSPDELKEALEAHGITADTTVVLYGKYMYPDNADEFPGRSAGDIGAMRNALILMYAGVKDVRILNGGFKAWEDASFQVDTDDVVKNLSADFGAGIPQKPELIVDIEQAKKMLASTDAELVSVRSYPEYIGEVSGYNYIEVKGRIPGAIFADGGSDAYHMENYRNVDHTVREYHETEQLWRNNGITPDKHLAFYCGTGWRASEAWFNAWLMAWPHISVFDGGWFEWSSDPDNPIETGIPEK